MSPARAQISSVDAHPRRRTAILDTHMSWVDAGQGRPIVFSHGRRLAA